MGVTAWPEQDRRWIGRYRTAMEGKPVPAAALAEREAELLASVRAAGLPAAEVFGAADVLAAEDAAELATADEAVRASEGAGSRVPLREMGGLLVGLGIVLLLQALVRGYRSVDVEAGSVLVALGVTAGAVAWFVTRALFSAGRPVAMVGVLVAAVPVAVASLVAAERLGPGRVVAGGVPVLLLAAGLIVPGAVVLVAVSRLPQPVLREDWDDDEWLRRFRGGLRARLVPASTARGHVAEVEQPRGSGATTAAEFGHPLVLARELAEVDRAARARRWWVSTLGGASALLTLAALVRANDSWGALTVPLVVVVLLGAVARLASAWGARPWATRR